MTAKTPEMVSLKYTGNYTGNTAGIGLTKPGDIVEVEAEFGEELAKGSSLFELAEPKKPILKVTAKKEEPEEHKGD